ncbi:hypothetical protein HpCOL17_18720 [Helicobacter pylori]
MKTNFYKIKLLFVKKELFEKYFQNIDEVTNKMLDQENQNKNSD